MTYSDKQFAEKLYFENFRKFPIIKKIGDIDPRFLIRILELDYFLEEITSSSFDKNIPQKEESIIVLNAVKEITTFLYNHDTNKNWSCEYYFGKFKQTDISIYIEYKELTNKYIFSLLYNKESNLKLVDEIKTLIYRFSIPNLTQSVVEKV